MFSFPVIPCLLTTGHCSFSKLAVNVINICVIFDKMFFKLNSNLNAYSVCFNLLLI